MLEIRLHGRGGQGGVTSAELVAKAVINQGRYAQAFPSFGPERRGAPVMAFIRVDDERIRVRDKVYQPNVVMVLDSSLLDIVKVAEGLLDDGLIVVNSTQTAEEVKQQHGWKKVAAVNADKVAREELGVPITNTTMLGALLKGTGVVPVEAMEEVIMERFGPKLGPKNYQALKRAYDETQIA